MLRKYFWRKKIERISKYFFAQKYKKTCSARINHSFDFFSFFTTGPRIQYTQLIIADLMILILYSVTLIKQYFEIFLYVFSINIPKG
jgi:hypothetical protein